MTARHIAGLLIVLVFFGVAGPARSQGRATEARKVMRMLDEVIETKDFVNPMTLKDASQLLHDKFSAQGKELPILVDVKAFWDAGKARSTATDLVSINAYDAQVQLPAIPKQMRLETALRVIVGQIGGEEATFVVRPGYIEITTVARTKIDVLLRERVRAEFTNMSMKDVLAELSAMTGAPIALDTRVKDKGREPVTILLNNLALVDALTVLTEQADLKFVTLETGIFVTTPAEAKIVEQQEQRRRKQMEPSVPRKK